MLIFATPAEAQKKAKKTEGIELLTALGYNAVISSRGDLPYAVHGLNLTLSAGYRWTWIGVYLEQNLGGVFFKTDFFDGGETSSLFVASTIISGKFFYHITDNLELWAQTGIGVYDTEIWKGFAFKSSSGLSYKINKSIMIGGDFSYTLAVGEMMMLHSLSPSIHLRFRI